jgi:hypothetical protein
MVQDMRRHDPESACHPLDYEVLIHVWFLRSHPHLKLMNLSQNPYAYCSVYEDDSETSNQYQYLELQIYIPENTA